MMGGVYYIWIMLGFFIGVMALLGLFAGALWVTHWVYKKETGAKEGFLELPANLRPADKIDGEANEKVE